MGMGGWGNGPLWDLSCPRPGRVHMQDEDLAATTGTRQLLGAWGHWPSRGRGVEHWRQLEGLGTLVLGEPQGL